MRSSLTLPGQSVALQPRLGEHQGVTILVSLRYAGGLAAVYRHVNGTMLGAGPDAADGDLASLGGTVLDSRPARLGAGGGRTEVGGRGPPRGRRAAAGGRVARRRRGRARGGRQRRVDRHSRLPRRGV